MTSLADEMAKDDPPVKPFTLRARTAGARIATDVALVNSHDLLL